MNAHGCPNFCPAYQPVSHNVYYTNEKLGRLLSGLRFRQFHIFRLLGFVRHDDRREIPVVVSECLWLFPRRNDGDEFRHDSHTSAKDIMRQFVALFNRKALRELLEHAERIITREV